MVLLSLCVQDQENNEAAIATGSCPLTTGDKASPKDIRSKLEEEILSPWWHHLVIPYTGPYLIQHFS